MAANDTIRTATFSRRTATGDMQTLVRELLRADTRRVRSSRLPLARLRTAAARLDGSTLGGAGRRSAAV